MSSKSLPAQQDPALYVYVGAFVDELQRAGVRNVVICPGSRSTPLALAFADQPRMRVWMHVDERSAAYFGLGMAKRLRQPVALLCTSGTAAANFMPAVVEAKLTHVPLLVLTADRPHELRDNGAPQSIDQNRLYGTYTKWFVDVALPEATDAVLRYIRTLAARAAAMVQANPAGPVHLNFPFREPLTPDPVSGQSLPLAAQRDAWQGRPDNTPYVEVQAALPGIPADATIERLMEMVSRARRGQLSSAQTMIPRWWSRLRGWPVASVILSWPIHSRNCAAAATIETPYFPVTMLSCASMPLAKARSRSLYSVLAQCRHPSPCCST